MIVKHSNVVMQVTHGSLISVINLHDDENAQKGDAQRLESNILVISGRH